jgi:hypothetical protein
MAVDPKNKIQALKAQIQAKIQKLLTEFAEGAISREQFHAVYERYTSQLAMAEMAIRSSSPDMVMVWCRTARPRWSSKKSMGKAVGMPIATTAAALLETLGDFDVRRKIVADPQ